MRNVLSVLLLPAGLLWGVTGLSADDLDQPDERYFVIGVIAGGTEAKPVGIAVLEDKRTGKTGTVAVGESLPGLTDFHIEQVERRAVVVVKTADPSVRVTLKEVKGDYQVAEAPESDGVGENTFLQRFYRSFADGQDPFVQTRPFRINGLGDESIEARGLPLQGEILLEELRRESAERVQRYRAGVEEPQDDESLTAEYGYDDTSESTDGLPNEDDGYVAEFVPVDDVREESLEDRGNDFDVDQDESYSSF